MRKKNYKGRCEKEKSEKCVGVCRTYDQIQYSYAIILSRNDLIKIILLFDKWWDKYIVPFSRRKHSNLERWASKPDMQYEESDTDYQRLL